MKQRDWIADYLTLSRKERIAVFVILFLVALAFCLPSILPRSPGSSTAHAADTAWIAAMKRLEKKQPEREPYSRSYTGENSRQSPFESMADYRPKRPEGRLFEFDPNTLSAEGWQQLGLREKTIKTILNFISKGGKFRKPEDLQRIYGLFPDEYGRLAPFIRISGSSEKNGRSDDPGSAAVFPGKTTPVRAGYSPVDINSADTAAFIALPGIGSKLAARIIHFREKLGGFYSITQVGETFGLADSVFQRIKPWLRLENPVLKKININTASAAELKKHPYLTWNIINAVIAYREEHGPYSRAEDIKKVMAVTGELYTKIAAYLAVE